MKTKIFLAAIFISIISQAQTLPDIQTDRPDQTECPFIVPVNYLQLESGFVFQKNNNNASEIAVPSVLTKLGINDHFELRMITEYILNQENNTFFGGLVPIMIGFKSRLFDEKSVLPTTSFIGHLALPHLASNDFKKSFYAPEFRFTMQHTVSSRQTLSYNLGAEWDGQSPEPIFIYTLTTGYSITDDMSGYIELFGFWPQTAFADHRLDGGLCYLVNSNQQLDLSAGFGIGTSDLKYYLSLGYSVRFKT